MKSSITERLFLFDTTDEGQYTEIDILNNKMEGIADIREIDKYRVTELTHDRLDLISFKFYGNYHMGWLICEYNEIIDPFSEISVGDILRIPSLDGYYRYFTRNARRVE